MPITPDSSKKLAQTVADMYFAAEMKLFKALKNKLKGAKEYAEFKALYNELKSLRKECNKIVLELGDESVPTIKKIISSAYQNGLSQVEEEVLNNADVLKVTTSFGAVSKAKVEALAKGLIGTLEAGHPQILRISEDIFRKVISEGVRDMAMGTVARQAAVQSSLNKFADAGIQGFVDKAGRRWSLRAYSEMAVRSGLVQANLSGTMDRMDEIGQDLVIVSEHPEECELCRPWENKVLSLSGKSTKYKSLEEARGRGLFHPNCSHSTSIYIEGYTEVYPKPSAAQVAAERKKYEATIRANQIDRNTERWQRREAAAFTDEEEQKAAAKVRYWSNAAREFRAANNLD